MTQSDFMTDDLSSLARILREKGEPFAVATVIRTFGATAAKPGAKAILDAQGAIMQGWIGGGCVRTALAKATRRAMTDGTPQLVSLAPEEVLAEKGVTAGDTVEGVRFARNGCPSKGSLDIFVEPFLPMPELIVFGLSPVARAVAGLAAQFQWAVQSCDATANLAPLATGGRRMVVVATQGKDDLACLQKALETQAEFIAFVGSARKWQALADKLRTAGTAEGDITRVQAPAGLAINAVTPDEIALSILAELTRLRRQDQRKENLSDD